MCISVPRNQLIRFSTIFLYSKTIWSLDWNYPIQTMVSLTLGSLVATYVINHFHHHVVPLAWISLTLSLATFPYRSSPLAGLQGYIPYPHIAAECMSVLVVLLLLGHMWRSIGVHHLWARPCFSSSVLHVWFV